MADANATDNNTNRAGQQLTADGDGKISATFYIKHGDTVKLEGVPAGAKYTVVETKEDYTPNISVNTTTGSAGTTRDVAVNNDGDGITDEVTGIQGNTTATFTNKREGYIPTGLITTVAASAVVLVIGAAGVICGIIIRKKRKTEE